MQRLVELVAPVDEHDELQRQATTPAPAGTTLPGAVGAPHLTIGNDPAAQLRWAQKMETLGRLTARVAHEVNNQLTLMLGRMALVLQRDEGDGASRAEVEELHRAAMHVARLMRRWQMLGRREPPARRKVDLNALVSDTLTMFAVVLEDGIELKSEPRARRPWVLAERGQLDHVLLNLLFNARDAMGGRGKLTVKTAEADLRDPTGDFLMPFTPGPYLMLSVADTGSGMDRVTLARVFEPYFTTKGPGKGTGLGLHTVWEIVRECGGTLQVLSAPGQGTVFNVYLPQAQAREETALPLPSLRSGRKTVLVVEDDDPVRALLREVLRRQGYSVLEACDGNAALQLADSNKLPIDLLVSDCLLPSLSGAALGRALRSRFPALRVLFVSGYPSVEAAGGELTDPCDCFLQKPFNPNALAAVVRRLLGDDPSRARSGAE
jgi:two-component system cell cycle sensor histidine kinase/response regulator CckA